MKEDLLFIPHIVINPSNIVSYQEVLNAKPRHRKQNLFIDVNQRVEDQNKFIQSTRKAGGKVSLQATRKISKAIEYILTTSKEKKVLERFTNKTITFKTAFLTLTLPSAQIHTDNEIINRCLNSFIIELTKYHNVKNYMWRAELQKNGNIHFHILCDQFVPWWIARNRWNRIINKLGYVDRFQEKHGHKNPNSTDIHSTRKIKNLKAYLVKYMSKDRKSPAPETETDEKKRTQSGRIWSCNHALSQTRGLNLIVDSEVDTELKKVFKDHPVRKYESDYFSIYYIDYHQLKQFGSDILFQYFSNYLFEQLGFSEQLQFTG